MSRLFSTNDTDGNARSLRLLVADQRIDQKAQLYAAGKGFITNLRPLTVAEVLPPHLRSGSSLGEATSFNFLTLPVKLKTEKIMGDRGASLQPNYTPIYRPGRYPYKSGMEIASSERLSTQKTVHSAGYGAPSRDATRNLDNDFQHIIGLREVQTQSQQASVGISHGQVPAQEKPSSETQEPANAQVQYHLARSGAAAEECAMPEGEAESSSSAWHGSPNYGWQADMGAPHHHQATSLTSTLVVRMEALRQQLLRVSSTLSSVQERAAHLASSMGYRNQSLPYNSGAADPYGSSHPVPGRPNGSGAATLTAMADLPTQRYFPPAGYADPSEGAGRSPSPYGMGHSIASDTRVYMVSVSAASDLREAVSPLQPEPLAALQYLSSSLSQHHHLSPSYESSRPQHIATSGQQEMPSALAAAAAAFVTTYKPVPDPLVASPPAASPRPQRLSPAVAVPPGALEEPAYHPFVLGSPAGHAVHVSLTEPSESAVGRGSSSYYASSGRHAGELEGLSFMSTPPNLLQNNHRVSAYDEESSNCMPGKGHYLCEGDDGHDGAAIGASDRGMVNGGGVAALHSQGRGAASGAGARGYSSMPPTTLRPTAAAAVAVGVAPHTLASAFTRQFDSPVLQELLMQSSQPRPPVSLEEIGPHARDREQLGYASRPGYGDTHQGGSADSATASPSLESHHRRLSSGVYSNASSQDAERVHPWSGGDGGMSSNVVPHGPSPMSPSGPAHLRGSDGDGSVAFNETVRTLSGRRPSVSGLSDVSSLDAARVHPWSGGEGPTASVVRLRSADGSLELMAAAPFGSQGYRLEGDGETDRGARERRTSISGRSIGDGSWLLLSPTVVVREVGGDRGAAVRTVAEFVNDVATGPDAEAALVQAATVSALDLTAQRQQDEQDHEKQPQQQGSRAGVAALNGSVSEDSQLDDVQEDEEEQEPSVAATPVSTALQAPFDADDSAGSGSGSTTPTPRADLSFAFHSASFGARDSNGDGDADGHQRGDGKDEDEGSDASRGERPSARPDPLASVGSRDGNDSHAGGEDDEILQTPTHDSPWGPLKLRYPGATDAAAASDAESDVSGVAGGGAGNGATASTGRRRWQLQPRGESSLTSASVTGSVTNTVEGLYDGYSEEEDEERYGGGNRTRRRREMMHPADSAPLVALSSTISQRAAAVDLYHNFSFPFPSKEYLERIAAATVTSSSSTTQKATTLSNAALGGSGGIGSAGSSTSGYGGVSGSPVVGSIYNADLGLGVTPETPDTASFSAVPHRLARPSRIVVPSSPRSSLGGWSLPSPIPSPYTYGVQGVPTPSSVSHAANFSLRKHLNLTVSSCLFADTSSEEGDDYDVVAESRLVGGYEPLRRQQQRADDVEDGEEVTSRPMSWRREDEEQGHNHDDDDEMEALEVEEEEIQYESDDDDEANAAVAAWAYYDARQAAEAARGEGNSDGDGGKMEEADGHNN